MDLHSMQPVRHRWLALFRLALLFWLGLAATARADAAEGLYAFVDARGTLHITDRLGDVPEPYQGIYRQAAAQKARAGGQAGAAGAAAAAAPAQPPGPAALPAEGASTASQAASRKQWQQLASAWRARLQAATGALRAAEERLQQTANPVLRETPTGRVLWQQAQAEAAGARNDALQARQMLLEVLPKRARDEHVPPQWLLP